MNRCGLPAAAARAPAAYSTAARTAPIDAELARAALCVAIAVRGGDVSGVIFHSDQGGEYIGSAVYETRRKKAA